MSKRSYSRSSCCLKSSPRTDRPASVERNSEWCPDFYGLDFNTSKAFFVPNGVQNVNVFPNMSNTFSQLNRGTPGGVLISYNFGRSTCAQIPFEIENGTAISVLTRS